MLHALLIGLVKLICLLLNNCHVLVNDRLSTVQRNLLFELQYLGRNDLFVNFQSDRFLKKIKSRWTNDDVDKLIYAEDWGDWAYLLSYINKHAKRIVWRQVIFAFSYWFALCASHEHT